MFRLTRILSVKTCRCSFAHASALSAIFQKQAISTNSAVGVYSSATETSTDMKREPSMSNKTIANAAEKGETNKGRFTAEEDALIRQRVAEWEGKGHGLWVALQKEMGRSQQAIHKRWNAITSAYHNADLNFFWTALMDEKLKEGVVTYKAEGWAKVAEYVGDRVTADKCRKRWNSYVQHDTVKRGAWEQNEVERLAELVPQHVVPSYKSKNTGRMTKERIDWTQVAAELGRLPVDCAGKWRLLQNATMKTGPFTDSENAMIRERVARWGDKGSGLWVGLQKDLGRPAVGIREQWVNMLCRE